MATSSVAEVALELASDADGVLGLVMLSPHSKGGHLEILAVAPCARGRGIGRQLVQALLQSVGREGPAMVSLTTRIPRFFSTFGFQPCCQLADGFHCLADPLARPFCF